MMIPILEAEPRLVVFAPLPDGRFDITPGRGPVNVFLCSQNDTKVIGTDWLGADLKYISEFCAGGITYAVHPRRVLAQLAYWRCLRGDRDASGYQTEFLRTRDLCEAFYGANSYVDMELRKEFSVELVGEILDQDVGHLDNFTSTDNQMVVVDLLYTLCKKIHSAT